MKTQYKGFDIEQGAHGPLKHRFWINQGSVGRPDGYASESAAKVAITKYLKQQEFHKELANEVFPVAAQEWMEECQREQDYFDRWSDKMENEINFGEKVIDEFLSHLENIVSAVNKWFDNFFKVKPSRRKREGQYLGKVHGKHRRTHCDHASLKAYANYGLSSVVARHNEKYN